MKKLSLMLLVLAASCGGGGDDGGSGATCTPSPSIDSTPPTQATVGVQYRYHVQFTMFCIPFFTACGVDLVRGPTGAGIDPIRVAVFWDPSSADAGTSQQFTIATKSDPCGNRATQSWTVSVN